MMIGEKGMRCLSVSRKLEQVLSIQSHSAGGNLVQDQGLWRGRCLPIGRSRSPTELGQIHPALQGFRLAANHFVRRRRTMGKHRPRHLPRGLSRHPGNRTGFE